MAKKSCASIKKPKMYQDMRTEGASKAKAAAVSNASAAGTLRRGKRGKGK
jgi:hypothetical protein